MFSYALEKKWPLNRVVSPIREPCCSHSFPVASGQPFKGHQLSMPYFTICNYILVPQEASQLN